MAIIRTDHRGVDVAEAVDLRGAQEADVDPPWLQPVVEDLWNAHDDVGGVGENAVADGQWQPVGLGTERSRLVDEDDIGCVCCAGEVRGRARQADPDEADRPIAQLPRRCDRHHLVGGECARHATGSACSTLASIQRRKVSRSLLIASHPA